MFTPKIGQNVQTPQSRLLISSLKLELDRHSNRWRAIQKDFVDENIKKRQKQSMLMDKEQIERKKKVRLSLDFSRKVDPKDKNEKTHKQEDIQNNEQSNPSEIQHQKALKQIYNPRWEHRQHLYYKNSKNRYLTIDDYSAPISKHSLLLKYSTKQQTIIALQKKYLLQTLQGKPSDDILTKVGKIIGEGLARVKTEQGQVRKDQYKCTFKIKKQKKEKRLEELNKSKINCESSGRHKLISPWQDRQQSIIQIYPI